MGAYAHQDVPFEKLVEELKPDRDLSRNPLFQVMFILQNAPAVRQEMAGVEVANFPLPGESSKFDLTLIAAESSEGLRTTIEYNTDLFDRSTIERLLGHFQVLMQAAVEKPDAKISDCPCSPNPSATKSWSNGMRPKLNIRGNNRCTSLLNGKPKRPPTPRRLFSKNSN